MIVLLAHGSPDARHGRAVEVQAGLLRDAGAQVAVAYLDHQQPALAEVVESAGDTDIAVVPLLLAHAYHASVDVPREIAALPRHVRLLSGWLRDEIVIDALLGALPAEIYDDEAIVVITAGSSDPESIAADERRAEALGLAVGVSRGSAAFASGPGQRPSVAIASAIESGAARVHVVSSLLAPGVLLDRAITDARSALRPTDTLSKRTLLGDEHVTAGLLAAAFA